MTSEKHSLLRLSVSRTALIASLLLWSGTVLAQTNHQLSPSTSPNGDTSSSNPAATSGTQSGNTATGEPQKHKNAASQAPDNTNSSNATHSANSENNPSNTQSGAPPPKTPSSEASGQGGSSVDTSPNHTRGQSTMQTQGSSKPTTGTPGNTSQQGATAPSSTQSASANTTANVNLTTQQRTDIHNTIINSHTGPRVTNLNITPEVGSPLPSVQFAPLPPRIVEMQPAWKGLAYFVFRDEIIIIDPQTRRIVAIIS
jgi:hypothetical protein